MHPNNINRTFAAVSNLQRLLERYRDDARTQQISAALKRKTPKRLLLSGTIGAQASFVLAGTFLRLPHNMLVVANTKDDAAFLHNNISNLFDKKNILFFPDSFKKPAHFEELNNSNVLLRAETVNKLVSQRTTGEIIVTYPEALFEKVVAPKELNKSRIDIEINEPLDVDTIIDVLVEYGFERVDFVYEPGQFSIRGGIVDIFSFGNDHPYRVELFDEEVESIRTFNPTTQLSKRKIARVSIVPNIQTQFSKDQKESLLTLLPENTSVWMADTQILLDKLQICFEKAGQLAEAVLEMEESAEREFLKDKAFIFPKEIMEDLLSHHSVEFSKTSLFGEGAEKITFDSKPQPSFNKNFELLVKDMETNMAESREIFLFTGNPRQLKRFYSIFEDMGANLDFHPIPMAIHSGFIDLDEKIVCYTDHQIFERYHKFRIKKGFSKSDALNIKMLRELRPGDFVTHIDHGVGKYSGLEKININGHLQEAVRLIYRDNDLLYVSINSLHKISKFVGKEGKPPKLTKLGSETWTNLKRRTKKKVKDIAAELIKLYAKRKASKGFAFQKDGYMQTELEASFIYEDTPDQLKATQDVKADMEKSWPMDRLICGDVGFGKTEIAVRAAFKSVIGGKQVAILVPTTILALQHFQTFNDRLKEFGVEVDYLNRFRTHRERRQIIEKLKEGKIDILIGTHGLLNKAIKFKDLGLLVIDEEQKFGVAAKEKLRNLKVNVDTLTLTATPIPRTLQFSLMAARDLSVINTPPPNRQPIQTEVKTFNGDLIKESIYYEIYRGGQVFFLHNRVKDLPEIMAMLRRLCPDVDMTMAHGQMDSKDLEKTLVDFINGQHDVLVCTNIIETGLDIPNANTIIINNAHHFGLSDLHQLRGRVGRSNKKAFCYLFCPPLSALTSDARKRLQTIEEFADLGSGFHIAMRDLDIRGAGNLLGGEQSGFITDIGYETYQKILDEAIQELKENEYKDLFKGELAKERKFVRDVILETDIEMLIPDDYVNKVQERLNLYTELDQVKTDEELEAFQQRLIDRFGKLPKSVKQLFLALRLRWLCKELGFERLILKSQKLRCFFVSNPESPYYETELFHRILQYVQLKADRKMGFKKSNNYFMLIKEGVRDMEAALKLLEKIQEAISGVEAG
ncbi:MAG: transcription-repair coupling factor [Bacteroidota bacterium]